MSINSGIYDILPYIAPFSPTLATHSFRRRYQNEISHYPAVFNQKDAAATFNQIWQQYLDDMRKARSTIIEELDTIVDLDKAQTPRKKIVNSTWLRKRLSATSTETDPTRMISAETISRCVSNGVLRKEGREILNPESAASLCIARTLDERERNWLPSVVPQEEEWWYCWSQETPTSPILPCPYPSIPVNMLPSTLLFTRWAGASWSEPAWLRIGYLGAITFVGLIWENRYLTNNLSFTDLDVWEKRSGRKLHPPHTHSETPNNTIDFSLGLSMALPTLQRYKHSGTLQAWIPHLRVTAQLMFKQGNVEQCIIKDQHDYSQPYELETLQTLDQKRGPFEWSFSNTGSQREPQSSLSPALREEAINILKRNALRIFSAGNLKNI